MGPEHLQAPLDCVGDLVPQVFYVKLQRGHSFQDHSLAIGQEIYPYINWIPIWCVYKKCYYAKGVDDVLLERILLDPRVSLVVCDSYLLPQDWELDDEVW